MLQRFALRQDEALYGYWALHALHVDPWFLQVWPDKPPLFLWLLSGAMRAFGASVAAARLPNILADTLTIALVAAIAQRLQGRRAAVWAALAMALNPFAISFAPTAYTDSLLVFLGILSFGALLQQRWLLAGMALGAAIMTKQQGILFLPLILFGWLLGSRSKQMPYPLARRLQRPSFYAGGVWLLCGVLFVVALILWWDALRWAVAPSPWDLSQRNYVPLHLRPMHEWPGSLWQWSQLAWYLTASWQGWGVALAISLWAGRRLLAQQWLLLLWLWALAVLALHLFTTVQVWDRYLLPLAPVAALSIALALDTLWPSLVSRPSSLVPRLSSRIYHPLLIALFLFAVFVPPAWRAATGGWPIGGDHGDYNGLEETLGWLVVNNAAVFPEFIQGQELSPLKMAFPLRAEFSSTGTQRDGDRPLPVASASMPYILYHQALGWHYRFYLFEPIRAGEVELRWYASSLYLADNASKAPNRRKFLLLPDWSGAADLRLHLYMHGFRLLTRYRSGKMTLYEIVAQRQAACDWCWCGQH
jgi:4-amino-4-deoxy-L-arabinose transferase-like glycosyltransferase